MLTPKVGLEAEFLVRNDKGDVILPPTTLPRDDFPILGEIRGEPGETMPETLANFIQKMSEIKLKMRKTHKMSFSEIARISLALYRKANQEATNDKYNTNMGVKNVYGTDITDFSDQVTKAGKIQGINISCGLHIHFSCSEVDVVEFKENKDTYTKVILPLSVGEGLKTDLEVYRKTGNQEVEYEAKATANVLTWPVVDHIVKSLDKEFFARFAPNKGNRTKYRQPGFFELKPYGFEYRSLPMTQAVLDALPEITEFSFGLLNGLSSVGKKW